MIKPRIWPALWGVTITLATCGCGRQQEIRKYEVPKRDSVNAENVHLTRERFRDLVKGSDGQDGFYGALVPRMSHMWLIELHGPRDRLEKHTDEFLDFIQSLEFTGKFPPGKIGPGWTPINRPGSLFAFAIADENEPLVLTMRRMPLEDRFPASMIMTFAANQWRDQLSLDPILADKLPDHSASFYSGDTTVLALNMAGERVVGEGSTAGLPSGHPPIGTGAATPPASGLPGDSSADAPPSPIDYVMPEGWQPGQRVVSRGGITVTRAAAFVVGEGESQLEITATILPPFAAALRQNVDRWRGQVGLGPATDEQLEQTVREIPVGEATGQYVEAIASEDTQPRNVIFGAIAPHDGKAWVFTLKGDFDLAEKQRESFLAFLKSIQFKKTDGADHGN